jgi:hypothetical protein
VSRIRAIVAFVAVMVLATALAVAVNTQFVLAGLRGLGAEIGAAETLRVTAHDVLGMGPLYGAFFGTALLLGFAVTALLWRRVPLPRWLSYAIGGGAAIAAMLAIMKAVLGMMVVAGARDAAGFVAQCAVGALAGVLFAVLTRPRAG